MSEPSLEARIRRLEDIHALETLKARYAAFCDADYDEERLAPLFTEDAVWDGGALGRYEGRDTIRAFFAGTDQVMPFAVHHLTNPILEVDGDRATGSWYLWQPCTLAQGNQALWLAGRYDDVYRREGGVWLFEEVRVTIRTLTPYEQGWARTPIIEVPS